tara:strand:- start:988 stop:1296 length:309 start_codon:yes stop_codon:yes gene_type:complete
MCYKFILTLLAAAFIVQGAAAETKVEHQCTDALMDVTRALMAPINSSDLNKIVNKSTNFIKVRSYINTKWIPKLKDDKSFTVNTFVIDIQKYVQECASFASQ